VATNPVSVLKPKTAGSKISKDKKDAADGEAQPINLVSVLQAENTKLRQAVVELLLDTMVLKEALQTRERGDVVHLRKPKM